jgi:hypothetical protein
MTRFTAFHPALVLVIVNRKVASRGGLSIAAAQRNPAKSTHQLPCATCLVHAENPSYFQSARESGGQKPLATNMQLAAIAGWSVPRTSNAWDQVDGKTMKTRQPPRAIQWRLAPSALRQHAV